MLGRPCTQKTELSPLLHTEQKYRPYIFYVLATQNAYNSYFLKTIKMKVNYFELNFRDLLHNIQESVVNTV